LVVLKGHLKGAFTKIAIEIVNGRVEALIYERRSKVYTEFQTVNLMNSLFD